MTSRVAARLLALVLTLMPLSAHAQANPVVVELFTSQGCSSCPPADAFLETLAKDPNILALAFHVDYWDRLGWKDTLGSANYTQRQYSYAAALGNRMVWTPQFVVHGAKYTRGNFRDMVSKYVGERQGRPALAQVAIKPSGGGYVVDVSPLRNGLPQADVMVATFVPRIDVPIERGENAGRTVSYFNTVTSWKKVGRWSGRGAEQVRLSGDLSKPFAVILQADGPGEIIAAAQLR